MRKIYSRILWLGVDASMPKHQQARIRLINFLELSILLFFLCYLAAGIVLKSTFVVAISGALLAGSLLGFWLQATHRHLIARAVFLQVPALLLFVVCNSLEARESFLVFYFIIFICYALYFDLETELPASACNSFITLFIALAAFTLPRHLLFNVQVAPDTERFFQTINYPFCFCMAIFYLAQIVLHINRSARYLIRTAEEAEKQKFELLEAKLKAESLALAQARFVSNMSHELRTPLNGIIGTVQLLLQEPKLPAQSYNFDVLKYSSEHMLSLINDVLDFSKIEAGKMELANEVFNLHDLMQKTKTVFEGQFANKGLQFAVDIDPRVNRDFHGDETRLNQVLNNLVSNAMKFTAKGSVRLYVSLTRADSQMATISFAVADTGIGIGPEKRLHIFQAFDQGETDTSRKFGGTGLGLTISKKLVALMGGELKVESEEGKGARFFFSLQLPFSLQPRAFVNENKVGRLQTLKGMRVLVAEDSPVNMVITRKFLQRWDVELSEAQNGRQTLELYETGRYDLLLIDLDMPVMDGYEALAEIRKHDRITPAIAFTAAVFPNMREQLQEKGFTDYLQKPFRPEDLHKKLALYGASKN